MERIAVLEVDELMSKRARKDLAAALSVPLDVASWMKPSNGKTPLTILNVAHLDDDERTLVLGVVLEAVVSWVRTLPGTRRLRAPIS